MLSGAGFRGLLSRHAGGSAKLGITQLPFLTYPHF
jgi:hypothetical protein